MSYRANREKKNSDENNTVRRCRADSKNLERETPVIPWSESRSGGLTKIRQPFSRSQANIFAVLRRRRRESVAQQQATVIQRNDDVIESSMKCRVIVGYFPADFRTRRLRRFGFYVGHFSLRMRRASFSSDATHAAYAGPLRSLLVRRK